MSSSNVRSPSPARSVRSTAPTNVGAGTYNDKKEGLKVEYFYGDRAKLGMFLVQLQAMFTLKPADFTTHPSRVLYAAMHMRGSAFHWVEPLMKDYLTYDQGQWEAETREIFGKYDNFVTRITQIFGTPGEEQQAAQRIHNLRQTGSAAQYFALFQRLKAKLNWEDNAYVAAFYQGLKDPIKDEMGMKPPKKLQDMVDKAIEIDNWLYERRLDKKGYKGKIGGSYYKTKSYQNYGDPMDLDAMERGRSSRPKGKLQRKGPSNKERERRKKENLCYNCGKSGHRAKECGTRPQGLYMMDNTAGIEEKKADTSMKNELEQDEELEKLSTPELLGRARGLEEEILQHLRAVREGFRQIESANKAIQTTSIKASYAEKAQKGLPEGIQKGRATPLPSYETKDDEVTNTAGTCRQKELDDEEADDYETIDKHELESWAFCFDDACPIHLTFKEQAGWFPHGKKNKVKSNKWKDARREEFMMMEQGETPHWDKYRMVMPGNHIAVISTHYWTEVPCNGFCTEPGPEHCGRTHRRFNPHGDPEKKEELVPLTRCDAFGCDHRRTHTHDILGEERYDFPFSTDEHTTDEEKEPSDEEMEVETGGKLLRRGATFAAIQTQYWKEGQCQQPQRCMQKHHYYDMGEEKQEKPQNVILWKCYTCKKRPPHFHTTTEEEWVQFPFKDDDTLDGEEATKETALKYEVEEVSDHAVIIKTHFWETDEWQGRSIDKFSPKASMQKELRLIGLPKCRNQLCEDKENEHTHWVKGVETHYLTYAQPLSDESGSEGEETQELMVMNQEDPEETVKFVVTKATRKSQTVVTRYWKPIPCTRASYPQDRQHLHAIYDPNTSPKEYVRTIVIQLCSDIRCQHSPELHTHREDDNEKMSIELPEEVAQIVYGKPNPTTDDVPKNDEGEA